MTVGHDPGREGCRALLERLSDYLDGELPDDACAHLEAHVADCEPCVRYLDSLRRTVGIVGRIAPPEVPEEIRSRLLEAWQTMRRR